MPPSSPWTIRSLPSHTPPLHRSHPPLSLRARTRLRLAVFVLAFLLTASTLYEVCFRQRIVALEEEWKYRVGEQLKMGVERMRVEGVEVDRKEGLEEGGGKDRGRDGEGDGDGTLVGGGGGMGMYGEGMGGGNGRWIDEVGEGGGGHGGAESEGRLTLPSSSTGVATSEVVVEGHRTSAAIKEGSETESKADDAEIPVETIALHAAESGLVGKSVESESVTFRVVEPSNGMASVTALDPPIQTPIKLRSEPLAYTVSFLCYSKLQHRPC